MSARLSPKQREILSTFAAGREFMGRSTQAIDGLVTRGLLVRAEHRTDWRSPSFNVTDAGRAALGAEV